MSISDEISRITNARDDIGDAIEEMGVTVPSGTQIDGMASLIRTGVTGHIQDHNNPHQVTAAQTGSVPVYGMGKNLLRNWYFVGGGTGKGVFPVNQRGGTIYTGNGYHMDGWINYNNPELILDADGVTISGSNLAAGANMMRQSIANPENYPGKTLTLSVLMKNATAGIYVAINDGSAHASSDTVSGTNLLKVTWTVGSNVTALSANFYNHTAGASPSFQLIAAKLEIGTEQTLAHQENGTWVLNEVPDYEEELIKCQTSTADSTDTYANKSLATEQQIAHVESGTTASRAYTVGEYFCWNGLLYRVTAAISSGGTFTPGTNCTPKTAMEAWANRHIYCYEGTAPTNTNIYRIGISGVNTQASILLGISLRHNNNTWYDQTRDTTSFSVLPFINGAELRFTFTSAGATNFGGNPFRAYILTM